MIKQYGLNKEKRNKLESTSTNCYPQIKHSSATHKKDETSDRRTLKQEDIKSGMLLLLSWSVTDCLRDNLGQCKSECDRERE